MKVLWIGDAVIQSGFSTVTHGICDQLAGKCDVTVFGIGYDGKFRNTHNYYIYPGADRFDIYSFNQAVDTLVREKSDVAVLFNDLPVVIDYAKTIRKVLPKVPLVALFPINIFPLPAREAIELTNFNICNAMTYTEFSKDYMHSLNPNVPLTAIYHGVDRGLYHRDDDCKRLTGLKDYFVVGYVGTNSYRKRVDLLLEGFAKFAKDKKDVRCLLHVNDVFKAYPLTEIAEYLGIKDKILLSGEAIPEDRMRLIYSVMDVNVNTSIGEGFGLPLLEGAACGVPILCSEHGNLTDIWSSGADFIKIGRHEYVPNSSQRGAIIDTDDMATKLERLYEDRNYLKEQSVSAYNRSIEPMFNWNTIASKVFEVITAATETRVNIIV